MFAVPGFSKERYSINLVIKRPLLGLFLGKKKVLKCVTSTPKKYFGLMLLAAYVIICISGYFVSLNEYKLATGNI